MVQESTMICVDNSEWMRNGDYSPTRLQAQQDAANLILQCKLRANPENAVGVLTMADEVCVLSTMTQENSKLYQKLHSIEPRGACEFVTGIKVAHLALKHRQNRNHKMRIVLFIGSPVGTIDNSELTKLAKKLKKEKVQVDIVCFGDPESGNTQLFTGFVDTLNGREGSGSNLVVVGPGNKLTDALMASAILRGEDGAAAPMVGGGFDFGGEEDDPDLALALRVSLEEQRARQAAQTGEEAPPAAAAADVVDMDMEAMTEDQQLEWALRMSMQETLPVSASADTTTAMDHESEAPPAESASDAAAPGLDDILDNQELLQRMVDELPDTPTTTAKEEDESSQKK